MKKPRYNNISQGEVENFLSSLKDKHEIFYIHYGNAAEDHFIQILRVGQRYFLKHVVCYLLARKPDRIRLHDYPTITKAWCQKRNLLRQFKNKYGDPQIFRIEEYDNWHISEA